MTFIIQILILFWENIDFHVFCINDFLEISTLFFFKMLVFDNVTQIWFFFYKFF